MEIKITGTISEPLTDEEYTFLMDALAQCGVNDVDIKEK